MSFIAPRVPVVVDASVAVAFVAEDDAALADRWVAWADEDRLRLVPPGFRAEVANALLLGKKLRPLSVIDSIRDLEIAGVEVADRGFDGLIEAIDLAAKHTLTVYDAAYLWLAIDVDGELATRDAALIRAAEAEGVTLARV